MDKRWRCEHGVIGDDPYPCSSHCVSTLQQVEWTEASTRRCEKGEFELCFDICTDMW